MCSTASGEGGTSKLGDWSIHASCWPIVELAARPFPVTTIHIPDEVYCPIPAFLRIQHPSRVDKLRISGKLRSDNQKKMKTSRIEIKLFEDAPLFAFHRALMDLPELVV